MNEAIKFIHEQIEDFRESPEGYGHQLRETLSRLMIERLAELGWTQSRLAKETGMKDSQISKVINTSANCQFDVAGRILHALGLPAQIAPKDSWATADTSSDQITILATEYSNGKETEGHFFTRFFSAHGGFGESGKAVRIKTGLGDDDVRKYSSFASIRSSTGDNFLVPGNPRIGRTI